MNIIAAFMLLGILVFIHELGHFLAGVAMKVPVEVFSIGFGPTILKKTIRDVRFQIAVLPFGGYCKFKGENADDANSKDDEDNFINISPIKRIFIYFTGPFFNYVFAVFIFTALFMLPTKQITFLPTVDVYENASYIGGDDTQSFAYKYGMRAGDTIISVNDKSVKTDRDVMLALSDINTIVDNDNVKFTVLRNDRNVDILMPSKEVMALLNSANGSLGFTFGHSLTLENIIDDSPAQDIGLEEGDTILAINGTNISYVSEFRPYVMDNANTKATLTILRNGEQIDREIMIGENNGMGSIGVMFKIDVLDEEIIEGLPIFSAVGKSFVETKNYLVQYVNGLGLLFTGKLPIRESLGGPVRIIQMTAQIAKSSIYTFLQLGAIISLILFFMNLLPLPVVDGGMIVVALIEIISRRRVNRAILSKIQIVGASILITLAILITANDITFLFK